MDPYLQKLVSPIGDQATVREPYSTGGFGHGGPNPGASHGDPNQYSIRDAVDAPSNDPQVRALEAEFRALETSILFARQEFLRQAGVTFDGQRDEYKILGYDQSITTKQYRDEYARGGIAGRIVDVMPDATWRGDPPVELVEDENPHDDTEFEKAWKMLDKKHQICSKLHRLDKLSRLSTFAVLLIGALGEGDLDAELPRGKPEQLLYLMPFSGGGGPASSMTRGTGTIGIDSDCSIYEYETDPRSSRFGLAKSYRLKRVDVSSPLLEKPVHWSRIIHVAEGLLDDEVFGQPALERVWNLLIDLRKVTGGGAEAFWLRANQGMHVDIDKDMSLPDTTKSLEALKTQVEAYKHGLDRWLRTRGVKVDVLGSDVANFSNPADAILTQIAGAKAIPKRILTGAEMGELASSQDRENFKDQVNGRQTQHAGPYMVRLLADRLIAYGYLPTPSRGPMEYKAKWSHTQVLTEAERVEGAKGWASVNQTQGEVVFTDAEIREKWADREPLTDEQRKEISDRKAEALKLQQEAMAATQKPAAQDEEKGRNPFQQRAAQALTSDEDELLQVLEEAIEEKHLDVINSILGLVPGNPVPGRKLSSVQIELTEGLNARMLELGQRVEDMDLAPDGRETQPHITVKYGLHTLDPQDVQDVLAKYGKGTISYTLGKTAVFNAKDYDVLVVSVLGSCLPEMNRLLSDKLRVTDTHPFYMPHATVAYLKPGLGMKYIGRDDVEGLAGETHVLTFSPSEGDSAVLSL